MRYLIPVLLLLLSACNTAPPKTQTVGGSISVTHSGGVVEVEQPSNPDEAAEVVLLFPDGTILSADTGGSRQDEFAGLSLKLDQYKVFTYVGAGVCVLGVGLTVASFWLPLIPKLAGPLIFVGGAMTAYLSTAIPEYGPYALALSLVGALVWFYHHSAGKKHPDNFDRRKRKQLQS